MKSFASILTIALVLFTTTNMFAAAGKIVSIFPSGQSVNVEMETGEILTADYAGQKGTAEIGQIVEVEKVCTTKGKKEDCSLVATPRSEF